MDSTWRRPPLGSLGVGLGIAIGSVVLGDGPQLSTLVGAAIGVASFFALDYLDGPLEKRTARIGAAVLIVAFVGGSLWLHV